MRFVNIVEQGYYFQLFVCYLASNHPASEEAGQPVNLNFTHPNAGSQQDWKGRL